ncbi:MAG: GNAT family N-acetyltransferase [Anaerolineaceae bacterium]
MSFDRDLILDIHPLTPERWADLESLFGTKGACGGCWCMYWRETRSQFDAGLGEANHQAFKKIVLSGRPVGLLAYAAGKPVGWMAIAPREEYPTLDRSRVLKRVDDRKVWSISCFYTASGFRGKGATVALLETSKDFVRQQHGTIIEGYPIIPRSNKVSPVAAYTGLLSSFLQVGFLEVARYSATRPIMRFELK